MVTIPGYEERIATILNGALLSNAVDVNQFTLTAIQIPAGMAGATLTFEGSIDNQTFYPINTPDTAGEAIAVAISSAGAIIPLNTDNFAGIRYIKVKAASNQTADIAINLLSIRATGGRG